MDVQLIRAAMEMDTATRPDHNLPVSTRKSETNPAPTSKRIKLFHVVVGGKNGSGGKRRSQKKAVSDITGRLAAIIAGHSREVRVLAFIRRFRVAARISVSDGTEGRM